MSDGKIDNWVVAALTMVGTMVVAWAPALWRRITNQRQDDAKADAIEMESRMGIGKGYNELLQTQLKFQAMMVIKISYLERRLAANDMFLRNFTRLLKNITLKESEQAQFAELEDRYNKRIQDIEKEENRAL